MRAESFPEPVQGNTLKPLRGNVSPCARACASRMSTTGPQVLHGHYCTCAIAELRIISAISLISVPIDLFF
eukprot:5705959-Amphidinium_carterae.2